MLTRQAWDINRRVGGFLKPSNALIFSVSEEHYSRDPKKFGVQKFNGYPLSACTVWWDRRMHGE